MWFSVSDFPQRYMIHKSSKAKSLHGFVHVITKVETQLNGLLIRLLNGKKQNFKVKDNFNGF
jgi:hypothetical protein